MANEDLGIKRDCPECGARFYDLSKDPAQCPKCTHEFVPEIILKPRRTRKEEEPVNKPTAKTEEDEDEEEDEVPPSDAETSLDEADKQGKTAKGKRKASLDDDDDEEEEDDDDDIPEIEEIEDADIDTENDDTLLADDEDEDDIGVGGFIKPAGGKTSDDA